MSPEEPHPSKIESAGTAHLDPRPPTIPDYELLWLVGQGAYGDVWLARSVTGIFRAVKIVWRDRFRDPQPFEREFKGLKEFAAISLDDPGRTRVAQRHGGTWAEERLGECPRLDRRQRPRD